MISIGFTGVDGTGKSTIVKMINSLYEDDKAVVQYMGLKNWETGLAKICQKYNNILLFRKIYRIVLLYELTFRVKKHQKKDKIVIFDRYVDEQYLQFKKSKQNIIGKCLEKVYYLYFIKIFYKPTIFFYLTCSIETSISRKDDIVTENDIDRLKINKRLMDEYYLNKENVIVIDTSILSVEDTVEIIKKELRRYQCFNI